MIEHLHDSEAVMLAEEHMQIAVFCEVAEGAQFMTRQYPDVVLIKHEHRPECPSWNARDSNDGLYAFPPYAPVIVRS